MHQECNICMCEQHNQIMRVRNYMYSNVQKKIMNSHDSQIPRLDRLAGSKHVRATAACTDSTARL